MGSETGFVLFDDLSTVGAPDIAFVHRGSTGLRSRSGSLRWHRIWLSEILSPSNTVSEIHEKVLDYVAARTRLVWVVGPRSPHSHDLPFTRCDPLITADDEIDSGDVLPGFRRKVSELFGR